MPIPLLTEEYLNRMRINDLIDLMAKSDEELLLINNFSPHRLNLELKQREAELIQKVIVFRKSQVATG